MGNRTSTSHTTNEGAGAGYDPTEWRFRSSFKQFGPDGYVDSVKFNEALSILENLGLYRLQDTPLGNRLFQHFDKDNSRHVSEDEFVSGCQILLGPNNNQKLDLTFQMYDVEGKGDINRADFMRMMKESWLAAFRALATSLQSKMSPQRGANPAAYFPTKDELLQFAIDNYCLFEKHAGNSFDECDVLKRGKLSKAEFLRWCSQSDRSITAKFQNYSVTVACTLINMRKENSPGLGVPASQYLAMPQTHPSGNNYPTFSRYGYS